MEIREVTSGKKRYLPLLLLADEQESMIDCYLDRGRMFVYGDPVFAECIVTDEGGGVLEIKSLAVDPAFQGRGFGRQMIRFLLMQFAGQFRVLQVGTSPGNIPFYEACGFRRHHILPGFFTEHYDHPICENGIQLSDMFYLQREIGNNYHENGGILPCVLDYLQGL